MLRRTDAAASSSGVSDEHGHLPCNDFICAAEGFEHGAAHGAGILLMSTVGLPGPGLRGVPWAVRSVVLAAGFPMIFGIHTRSRPGVTSSDWAFVDFRDQGCFRGPWG